MRARTERAALVLVLAGASLQLLYLMLERPVAEAAGYEVRTLGWASAALALLMITAGVTVVLLWRWGKSLLGTLAPIGVAILWRWAGAMGFGFPSIAGNPMGVALLNVADRLGLWLLIVAVPLLLIPGAKPEAKAAA